MNGQHENIQIDANDDAVAHITRRVSLVQINRRDTVESKEGTARWMLGPRLRYLLIEEEDSSYEAIEEAG